LTETTDRKGKTFYDWPLHMAGKTWVDIDAFLEAFIAALAIHAGKYPGQVDGDMLAESRDNARIYQNIARNGVGSPISAAMRQSDTVGAARPKRWTWPLVAARQFRMRRRKATKDASIKYPRNGQARVASMKSAKSSSRWLQNRARPSACAVSKLAGLNTPVITAAATVWRCPNAISQARALPVAS